MDKKFPYLFGSSQLLFEPIATKSVSKTRKSCEEDFVKDDILIDSNLLSHSEMSWSPESDRYVMYETSLGIPDIVTDVGPNTLESTSAFVLDHMPLSTNEDAIKCLTESIWGSYTLDEEAWNDDRAPVVKLRQVKDLLFQELEFCGFFTDRLIGIGSSFLSKSPENGLYVLNKCSMRNMCLSNITLLYYHRYLRYIDLSYNYISDLVPLGGIPYLMFLNLEHNRVSVLLDFTPPWYLTYVKLSYNHVTQMRDISDFWSIVHLDLSHNAIEVISGLQDLKYLKHLNLSYNLIECFENLDKLNIQELNLEGNCIASFKSAVPSDGINSLPHLREIYLGYNKITTLEFFCGGYSLRVIDLKFNRINDLLELSNFKGLIYKIDLRGNGCTKWPTYKAVILFSIPSLQFIDGEAVSTSEKVSAANLFLSPVNLTAARTVTKLTLLEHLSTPKIGPHVMPYDKSAPPLIILTGPPAVRKISLALRMAEIFANKLMYCKWHTTKQLEDGPYEHQTYILVDREVFHDMSRCGDFLAIQDALGNSYGFHHNQIAQLVLENKIGITQMGLHATLQMSKRYSNIKPILILTESEQVHRDWIQEKFDIFTCVKESIGNLLRETKTAEQIWEAKNTIEFIRDLLYNIVSHIQPPSSFIATDMEENENEFSTSVTSTEIETEKSSTFIKTMDNEEVEVEVEVEKAEEVERVEVEVENIEEKLDDLEQEFSITFEHKSNDQVELRVLLDEYANIVVEDEKARRERRQERHLRRRKTLYEGHDDMSESISSEEMDFVSLETKKPELLKNIYTDLIIQTRQLYQDHHINNPGFFSIVLLTDNYLKAFNRLIDFIYETYTNYSNEKPKFQMEIEHFSQVTIPEMIEQIVDEIRLSLSTPILQRKTLLRSYGITSWKDLMPSQRLEDLIECTDFD